MTEQQQHTPETHRQPSITEKAIDLGRRALVGEQMTYDSNDVDNLQMTPEVRQEANQLLASSENISGLITSVPGFESEYTVPNAVTHGDRIPVPMPADPNHALGYNDEANRIRDALRQELRSDKK